ALLNLPLFILRKESSSDSLQIATQEMFFVPTKIFVKPLIFLCERYIRDSTRISIDVESDSSLIQLIDRMVFIGLANIGLDIGSRADLKMNMFPLQILNQVSIFYTTYAMTDT